MAADERVELVVLDLDAAPERRLQGPAIGRGDRAPADGVEEGVEDSRIVKARRLWQRAPLERPCARLDLPDDLERFAGAVVLDRRKGDQMLVVSRRLMDWRRGES